MIFSVFFGFVFFFKQKTAYEMRISDWSSDVCSSDLLIIEDELAGLAIKLRVGAVVREIGAIKGKAAVFRFFGNSLDIVGLALRAPLIGPGAAFVVGNQRAVKPGKAGRASGRERVCRSV